jgi:hypothetical protein
MTRSAAPTAPAIFQSGIEANGIYALRDFQARMRVGRHWMRSARAQGLVVRSRCGRSFVAAKDFLAFIEGAES